MRNIKISILTLAFLSANSLAALSMAENDEDNPCHIKACSKCLQKSNETPKYIKKVLQEKDDIPTTLNPNSPVELMRSTRKHGSDKSFDLYDNSNKIFEDNGKITVAANVCNSKGYRHLLTSRKFFVTEDQRIKVSFKANVLFGNFYIGLLNEKRTDWYDGVFNNSVNLSGGSGTRRVKFEVKVPKGETAASFVIFQFARTETDKGPTAFTIKKLKLNQISEDEDSQTTFQKSTEEVATPL